MVAKSSNVTAAKPKVGGAIYSAPLGTDLPENAIDPLNEAFKALGYVSEDGLTNEDTRESEEIKAWGGDVVETPQTSKADKFKYTLIEMLNVSVLKEVYGDDNVTGNLSTGITVKSNSKELKPHIIIIEMVLKGGVLKRIIVPNAKVIEVGEINYKDSEVAGYETTVQALPDENEDTHIEYIQSAG
ncbi:phage tail tube protein [Streptococcus thoraltensis]